MSIFFRIFTIVWLLSSAFQLSAAGTEVAFDAANKLYEEGKFAEAAVAYDKLLAEGHRSGSIYYNLGTACFKAGQMGRAIAAFRKAAEFIPRDTSLRANLQFVRKKVNGEDRSPVPFWHSWLSMFTLNEGAVLAAATFWIWFLLLAAGEFRSALKASLRTSVMVAGLLTVFLAICLGAAAYLRLAAHPAVVVVREAVARFGPLDEAQTAFQLPDGAEVTVLDSKDNWLQIRERSNRIGWVKKDQLLRLDEKPAAASPKPTTGSTPPTA